MSPNTNAIKCSACMTTADYDQVSSVFENEDRLLSHIATQHVFWVPFECVLCPMMCSTEKVLKLHYQQTHIGLVPKAIYTYEELKKREMRRIFMESKQLRLQDSSTPSNDSSLTGVYPNGPISILQTSLSNRFLSANEESLALQYDDPNTSDLKIIGEKSLNCVEIQTEPSIKQDKVDCENDILDEQSVTELREEHYIVASLTDKPAAKKKSKHTSVVVAKGEITRCALCGTAGLFTFRRRQLHIWRSHISRPPIECRHCDWNCRSGSNSQRRDQRKHIRMAHPEMTNRKTTELFIDYRQKLNDEFRKKFEQAYQTQFRELLEKPNEPARMPRQKCTCKLCNNDVPQNRKSAHIWFRHMTKKRCTCNLCPYGSPFCREMNSHVASKHRSEIGEQMLDTCWTDNTLQLNEEYRSVFLTAFGTYNVRKGAPNKTNKSLHAEQTGFTLTWCNVCVRSVVGSKNYHVWMQHMRQKRFTCNHCNYSTSFKRLIEYHMRQHKSQKSAYDVGWSNITAQLKPKYDAAYQAAFGPDRSGQKNTDENIPFTKPPTNRPKGRKISATVEGGTSADNIEEQNEWCNICGKNFSQYGNKTIHVWAHHVGEKRFSCNFCPFEAPLKHAIECHVEKRHSEETEALWTDHRNRLFIAYRDAYRKAFGHYYTKDKTHPVIKQQAKVTPPVESPPPTTEPTNAKRKAWCKICERFLCAAGTNSKSYHIWREHVTDKRFICTVCGHGLSTPSNKRTHSKAKHHDEQVDEERWIDNTKQLVAQYLVHYKAAFGNYQRPRGRRSFIGEKTEPLDTSQKDDITDVDTLTACRLCQMLVGDRSLHIRHCHMTAEFECQIDTCTVIIDRGGDSVKILKQHMDDAHPERQYTLAAITQRSDSLTKEYAKLMRKAFGKRK